ncbi:MAG: bifunctional folylpolyglutamate synthase/dihydrofolate synthase, partial [Crocinitomicaceae bacterium]|nr:bifunctional folylpolyglutamate synthase/dihydrofolate synthase [Crocinitomicaceae bacterium]
MSKSKLNKEYQEAIDWLFYQFPSYQVIGSKAYKPTLENIYKILERIGHPEKELKFVHVAGSNGKGSVCSLLASVLKEANHKVGLFTSPHIIDYTERIRVNGVCIDEESVVNFVHRIKAESFDFSPSFFEVTFALALDYFQATKCDICVIETGLGGRLDATNIISPLLTIITTISLEHTNILGNTL